MDHSRGNADQHWPSRTTDVLVTTNALCTKGRSSEENTANSQAQTVHRSQAMDTTNSAFLAEQWLCWYNTGSVQEEFQARHWPISPSLKALPSPRCNAESVLTPFTQWSSLKRSAPMLRIILKVRWPWVRFPHLSFRKLFHFA